MEKTDDVETSCWAGLEKSDACVQNTYFAEAEPNRNDCTLSRLCSLIEFYRTPEAQAGRLARDLRMDWYSTIKLVLIWPI